MSGATANITKGGSATAEIAGAGSAIADLTKAGSAVAELAVGGTSPVPPAFTPGDLTTLEAWWRIPDGAFQDAGGGAATTPATSDGDPIGTIQDQSGNAHHYIQASSAAKPTLKLAITNGQDVARLDGGDFWAGIDLSSLTEGEWFIVWAIDTDPPASASLTGAWAFGTGASRTVVPFTDGVVYDGWGSTVRKTTGNPTVDLTTWNLYHVLSKSGEWTSRINNTVHFTTGTNTVGFNASNVLGGSPTVEKLDGDIAEAIVLNAEASAGEKASLMSYINTRYGIVLA